MEKMYKSSILSHKMGHLGYFSEENFWRPEISTMMASTEAEIAKNDIRSKCSSSKDSMQEVTMTSIQKTPQASMTARSIRGYAIIPKDSSVDEAA